jgi:ATP-dependent exoDNAse (exonuclease V) beta subunit
LNVPRLPDSDARSRIATDLEATLCVEAAAGTGKTTALVGRMLAVLRCGRATLDQIVAVTFTEKAAGEMKLRLRTEIEKLRAGELQGEERRRLEHAVEQLEVARIGTIHAFCADLLLERPVEAHVDPAFEMLAEDAAEAVLEVAFTDWFESILEDPPEGVARMLRRRAWRDGSRGPREQLLGAARQLVEHRDHPTRWRRDPFDRHAVIDAVVERMRAVGALHALAQDPNGWLAGSLGEIHRFVEELDLRERSRDGARDHDGLEADIRSFLRARHWKRKGWASERFLGLSRDEVLRSRDQLRDQLGQLVAACDADLAACLSEDLRPVVERYEARKRQLGRLDFLDLLLHARDLVRGEPAVRADLQQRFRYFFVDEFQDTDPLQAELLLLLAASDSAATDWRRVRVSPGKLFLVGDPKQAIYRFRRADVRVYAAVREQLLAQGAAALQLSACFRSAPGIEATVNAAFAPLMPGEGDADQPNYVPLHAVRSAYPTQPNVIALPVPQPYGPFDKVEKGAIDESLPRAVAAFLAWLLRESRWTVEEAGRSGVRVPVEARHVCLLFRRMNSYRTDVTHPYVRALQAARVPHVLLGGSSFHAREEIMALRQVLAAVEWPDDALKVFAALRGPFFGFTDEELLVFRHRTGTLHPLQPLDGTMHAPKEREVAEALALLRSLHEGRNRVPIAVTVQQFLAAVRAHAGIAIWPTGEQALANCLRIVDRARRFERQGAASFRAFVTLLERDAELQRGEEVPIVEEGTEGVRMMTVHRAKGLEFPVVILADLSCRAIREEPSHHIDAEAGLWAEPLCGAVPAELREHAAAELGRELAEAHRVTYVAATRARDLLVVPVLDVPRNDGAQEPWWLDPLAPVLLPARLLDAPAPAPGCPHFPGADGERSEHDEVDRVRPGLHASRAGAPVVVWDRALLAPEQQEEPGLRQEQLLHADATGVAAAGDAAHRAWAVSRQSALAAGGVPTLRGTTVTAHAAAVAAAGGEPVAIHRVAVPAVGRPHGVRFGSLVHAVLAVVPFEAGGEAVQRIAAHQGRCLGATAEEVAAAVAVVQAALRHPLLARAAAAKDVRRECPLWFRLDDGTIVEGVLDLAFREARGGTPQWTVVDFKTDLSLDTRQAEYEAQVRLYARAVAQASGEPAAAALLVM